MIQNSNEFLNSVLENISDGIVACNKDGILTLFNSALKNLHGLPVEPLPASEWANHYSLYHEDGVTLMKQEDVPLFRALKGEKVSNVNIVIKRKDGIIKHAVSSGDCLRNKKGEIIGAVASMKDVTESVIYRAELDRQNAELRKINQELDRFVYSTSHELRSPLASVLGLVSLAKADEADEEKLSLLKMIENSVNKLDDFIEDINDYARNNRLNIAKDEVNFEALIQESISQMQYMENAHLIKFDIKIDSLKPIYCDLQRWRVVVNNFISNAIKYCNPTQNQPYVSIVVKQNQHQLTITFTDNGQGIKEAYLENIFKMFYRATSNGNGTGLGLFIVYETIDKMGGTIDVKSIYGKGTTFTVVVPYLAD